MHSSTPSCRGHLEKQPPVGSVGREENGDPRIKPLAGNADARVNAPTSTNPLDKLESNSTPTSHDIQTILQGLVSQAMHQIRSDVVKSVQDALRGFRNEPMRVHSICRCSCLYRHEPIFRRGCLLVLILMNCRCSGGATPNHRGV